MPTPSSTSPSTTWNPPAGCATHPLPTLYPPPPFETSSCTDSPVRGNASISHPYPHPCPSAPAYPSAGRAPGRVLRQRPLHPALRRLGRIPPRRRVGLLRGDAGAGARKDRIARGYPHGQSTDTPLERPQRTASFRCEKQSTLSSNHEQERERSDATLQRCFEGRTRAAPVRHCYTHDAPPRSEAKGPLSRGRNQRCTARASVPFPFSSRQNAQTRAFLDERKPAPRNVSLVRADVARLPFPTARSPLRPAQVLCAGPALLILTSPARACCPWPVAAVLRLSGWSGAGNSSAAEGRREE